MVEQIPIIGYERPFMVAAVAATMNPLPSSWSQKLSFAKYCLMFSLFIIETFINSLFYNSQWKIYLLNKVQ
jgi:branched-subunit amino acid transport protein